MKDRISFWDILAWVALGIIISWLILKMFGIINTPLWLEYTPIYSAIYIAGWAMSTLIRTTQDVRDTNRNLYFTNRKVNELDKEIGIIKINLIKRIK